MSLPALKPSRRRRYPPEFKHQLVDQCQPGVSIAGVALAHGINANLLRRWIHERSASPVAGVDSSPARLVPVTVQSPPMHDSMVEITVTRKGNTIAMRWPVSAAGALSTLLADWLK